ncbi:hypothetical protein BVX97_00725 [bacterium E08(2017)]|nr:hypothetical protein BVX97_00725 [bacterium E08(2017)]
MKTYIYKAKDGPGREVEGELRAESSTAAAANIDALGYVPVWIKEKPETTIKAAKMLGKRITYRDVTVFTRQLGSLTKSGVPILKALTTIGEQTENTAFAKIIRDLEAVITDGNMLSGALRKYPKLFSDLYINMVQAGESGGVLDTVLFRLAETREREEELRRKVSAAVAYPLLVILVGVGTVVVLLTFFLPKVLVLFKDYNDLPLPTRMLIGTSEFFENYWYWIVLVLLLIGAVIRRMAVMENGRAFFDRLKLKLPLLGKFFLRSDISRFARTLSLLTRSGIPVDRGLALSAETLDNSVLREEIRTVGVQTVREGSTVSAGLKKTEFFPPLIANMTAVGEESGAMDDALLEVAEFYDKEIDSLSKLATSLIEPILILVVGLIIGFIVAAMLLPIFQLGTSI